MEDGLIGLLYVCVKKGAVMVLCCVVILHGVIWGFVVSCNLIMYVVLVGI